MMNHKKKNNKADKVKYLEYLLSFFVEYNL